MYITIQNTRIGNIYQRQGVLVQAVDIGTYGFGYSGNGIGGWHSFKHAKPLEPVRLTDDVIKKLGLIKEGVTFKIGKYILWYVGTSETDYRFMLHDERDNESSGTMDNLKVFSKSITTVEFLHQLQNVYHDLTNTELNTKPLL